MKQYTDTKILFSETNYSYLSKNGKTNPKFDFLVTKVLFIPLVILCLFFGALNIYEYKQGHIYIPYVFQNIVLFTVAVLIFVFYPRKTLVINEREIYIKNRRKILKSMPLSTLKKVTFAEKKQHSILPYYRVTFENEKKEIHATIVHKAHLKKVLSDFH